jgi:hypothetical protein
LFCLFYVFINRRHWKESSISPAYELNLLRWEVKMQQELGQSVANLMAGLGGVAAEVRLYLHIFVRYVVFLLSSKF